MSEHTTKDYARHSTSPHHSPLEASAFGGSPLDCSAFEAGTAGTNIRKPPAPLTLPMPADPERTLAAQTILHQKGLYPTKPDGIRGKKTVAALKAFQLKAGLEPTGEIDQNTWQALHGMHSKPSFFGYGSTSNASAPASNAAKGPADMSTQGIADWMREQAQELKMDRELGFPKEALELDMERHWKGQKRGSTNCDEIAQDMVEGHLAEHPGLYKGFGSMMKQKTAKGNSLHLVWEEGHERGTKRTEGKRHANLTSTLIKDEGEWDLALRYIAACLKAGVPVMVGVNHTYAYKRAAGNPDQTTDHWLTVVGMGQDEKGRYFSYLDPGRSLQGPGADTKANRLYQTSDAHIWRDNDKDADTDAGQGSYTLVAVALYSLHCNKADFKVGSEIFKRKL